MEAQQQINHDCMTLRFLVSLYGLIQYTALVIILAIRDVHTAAPQAVKLKSVKQRSCSPRVWHYLYDNPPTPTTLARRIVINIAQKLWGVAVMNERRKINVGMLSIG